MPGFVIILALLVQGIFGNTDYGFDEIKETVDDVIHPDVDKIEIIEDHFRTEFPTDYSLLTQEDVNKDVEDAGKHLVPSKSCIAEQQIAALKEAMDRLNSAVTQEFEKLATDFLNCKTRRKRDVTERTGTGLGIGNKRLMRLLNHIRATNEKQNSVIDKMMSAKEIAEKFGIELIPEGETNLVTFDPTDKDLDIEASEQLEDIETPIDSGEQIENTIEKKSTYETTVTDLPTIEPPVTEASQQYYYEDPHFNANQPIFQANDGSYYYYQIKPTPPVEITQNPEAPSETYSPQQESPQIDSVDYQPKQMLAPPPATGSSAEQLSMHPQQPYSERPNPFYTTEEEPISYALYSEQIPNEYPNFVPAVQEQQVVMVMSPVEEPQQPDIVTEEVHEIVTSEDGGDQPRLKHVNRSSYYRLVHVNAVPHIHHKIAALPQQFKYYFSLI